MARSTPWGQEASGAFRILQHELNRLLEDYLRPTRVGAGEQPPTDLDPTGWIPAVDVYESPEEMVVVVEVPGVDQSRVELALTGNVLSIRGVKDSGPLPESQLQLRERRFGSFHRELTLPHEVDFEKAHAQVDRGLLSVRLPKMSAGKPRTIPIRVG
jgi:HSP20 family protein